jgi:hypothetical protein
MTDPGSRSRDGLDACQRALKVQASAKGSVLNGTPGVLLAIGTAWLVIVALAYSFPYQMCNPSGSGCYVVIVHEFGDLWPLVFVPGVFFLIAFIFLLRRSSKRASPTKGA